MMNNPSPNVSPCNSVLNEGDVDDVDLLDSDATAPENNDMILGVDAEFGVDDDVKDKNDNDESDNEKSNNNNESDNEYKSK